MRSWNARTVLEKCLSMQLCNILIMAQCTLRASLSATFLQTLPDLVTPLKGHSLSPPEGALIFISAWRGTLYLRLKGHSLSPLKGHSLSPLKGHSLSPLKGHSLSPPEGALFISTEGALFISAWRDTLYLRLKGHSLSPPEGTLFISAWRDTLYLRLKGHSLSPPEGALFISAWRGTLYLRAAVQRRGHCPQKGSGTNMTVEAT